MGFGGVVATACSGTGGEQCVQAGPPPGYPLRDLDIVLVTGFRPSETSIDLFMSYPGGAIIGLQPASYPQLCGFPPSPDIPGYRFVGWIDGAAYDGGPSHLDTYCQQPDATTCHPQPGQSHGEVTVTLSSGKTIVTIPMSP
jgi:hypothetical protein